MSTRCFKYTPHECDVCKQYWSQPKADATISLITDPGKGSWWPDALGVSRGLYVSEHVKRDWDEAGIDYGYATEAIVQKPYPRALREKAPPPNYYWIRGHKGVQMDRVASGCKDLWICKGCKKTYANDLSGVKGDVFVPGTWDGSDLFVAGDPPTWFFCTEKILKLAADKRRTNFRFIPIEESHNTSYPAIDYLGTERKRARRQKKSRPEPEPIELPPEHREGAEKMLAAIQAAFETGDCDALTRLSPPEGQDEATKKFDRSLIQEGYKVFSTKIEGYHQPKWSILRTYEFYPPPVFSIAIILKNSRGGEKNLYCACGPYQGGYCLCYYKKREKKPRKRDKAPGEGNLSP